MSHTFIITEVFAEAPYGGNQLATLLDAGDVPGESMQRIARAFNFSESTFVTGGDLESGFDVRIFTPSAEIPFAGHPTLGTAFVIRERLLDAPVSSLTLNLGVGKIAVTFADDGVIWMRQKTPDFGETVSRDRVAAELGLDRSDISGKAPCRFVSTGLEFLIVPLSSMAALKSARARGNEFDHGLLAFCEEGYDPDQQLAARMFASHFGVIEDPATGSANGCLAAYLVEHAWFGEETEAIDIRVGQGYEIGRPSQLYLRVSRPDGIYQIDVGGKVRIAARGEWL